MTTPETTPSTTPRSRTDRTLLVILSVIAVLVIIALAVVFIRGTPQSLDAATPQGVVQRYAAAVVAGDETEAQQFLTPAIRATCDRFETVYTDDLRVVLVDTTERADSADVKVSLVTSYSGGLFGPSEYESAAEFGLTKSGEEWLIEKTPWELTICADSGI